MKVIDLLNKIGKGEEVPEKIKYKGDEYWYNKNRQDYKDVVVSYDSYLIDSKYHTLGWLNDTVEIIEEQQDIDIQSIKEVTIGDIANIDGYANERIKNKINELIQAVKQLDKK